MSFLGIDLGTGGVRCLLVSESGEILADQSRSLSQINLSDVAGHSEQDANEWISVLADALDELFANPPCTARFRQLRWIVHREQFYRLVRAGNHLLRHFYIMMVGPWRKPSPVNSTLGVPAPQPFRYPKFCGCSVTWNWQTIPSFYMPQIF